MDDAERRAQYGKVFEAAEFICSHPRNPGDEYEHKRSGIVLYFYWKQGGDSHAIIGINPQFDYAPLLKVNGVRLRLAERDGLRAGTAMRSFPSSFGDFVPKDKQSKVGRFIEIEMSLKGKGRTDERLLEFLNNLVGNANVHGVTPGTAQDNSGIGDLRGYLPSRPPMLLEDFLRQQERNSETGAAGELVALKDEYQRLAKCGCSNPEKYVKRISTDDVGRGYDIESTWPNEERYIEVKSSTQSSAGFYISRNERAVLTALGARGWIYLVEIESGREGRVTRRLRDAMQKLPSTAFEPVNWHVQVPAEL